MNAVIKVHFIDKMGNDSTAVNAARISFANQSALGFGAEMLPEKDIKLLDYLAKNKHYSPFEHCAITVMIECPLYIRSQIHRHRTFAYNEVSRRYTADALEYYLPPRDDIRAQSKSNKQASDGPISEEAAIDADALMRKIVMAAELTFDALIEMGVSREQARGILPQCLMTKFYMTGNLRNWAHFVALRDHAHAQKEVQVIGKAVKALMLEKFPEAAAALFRHGSQ